MSYRKHYNPIYKLWELQRKRPSGFGTDMMTWEIVSCHETEAEVDARIEQMRREVR